MKEIIAYTMVCTGMPKKEAGICCVPFEERFWPEYQARYNECFYEMRKALEIEPFNYLSDFSQMSGKAEHTFLYFRDGAIAGAVSCYGNEIDDLFVAKPCQGMGIGKALLLWGMHHIRNRQAANGGTAGEEIFLHAAAWNERAVSLYKKMGFVIAETVKVR